MEQVEVLLKTARVSPSSRLEGQVRQICQGDGNRKQVVRVASVAAVVCTLSLAALPQVRAFVTDLLTMPGTVRLISESGETATASVAEAQAGGPIVVPKFIPDGYHVRQQFEGNSVDGWTFDMIINADTVVRWDRPDGAAIIVVAMTDPRQAENLRREIEMAARDAGPALIVTGAGRSVGLIRPFPIDHLGVTATWLRWEEPVDQVNMVIATHESQSTVEEIAASMGW